MSEAKQKYLGTKTAIVLCVDSSKDENIIGRMFHLYKEEMTPIYGYNHFFLEAEQLFKALRNPKASQSDKDFDNNLIDDLPEREMTEMNTEASILNEHGEQGTFIVRVQHRQHSSWQGRVTWVDEDKTVYFRSELELMKLIDGALNQESFDERSA